MHYPHSHACAWLCSGVRRNVGTKQNKKNETCTFICSQLPTRRVAWGTYTQRSWLHGNSTVCWCSITAIACLCLGSCLCLGLYHWLASCFYFLAACLSLCSCLCHCLLCFAGCFCLEWRFHPPIRRYLTCCSCSLHCVQPVNCCDARLCTLGSRQPPAVPQLHRGSAAAAARTVVAHWRK